MWRSYTAKDTARDRRGVVDWVVALIIAVIAMMVLLVAYANFVSERDGCLQAFRMSPTARDSAAILIAQPKCAEFAHGAASSQQHGGAT